MPDPKKTIVKPKQEVNPNVQPSLPVGDCINCAAFSRPSPEEMHENDIKDWASKLSPEKRKQLSKILGN
jgi:hypothetical protein